VEDDAVLVQKVHQIGPKWVQIGRLLSGNNVKNRWHKHLYRRDAPMLGFWQPIALGDCNWPHLFNAAENPFAVGWGSFSFGDPLF
jgi:hypothetical protein